jgi:cation diffusion facilitator CzcD-associated flavoprotein CzcO
VKLALAASGSRVAVVGAGPHGVAVATALAEELGAGAVTVVDPEPEPLAAWHRRAVGIGMHGLRSPWVHHVGRTPHCLGRHYAEHGGGAPEGFSPPLGAFEAHALDRFSTSGVRLARGRVTALERGRRRWRLVLDGGGTRETERVVVAVGLDPHRRPGWGGVLLPDHGVGVHRGRVAVVGGGHTAATAAARLLATGARVDLFAPGGLRARSTDLEPGWFGPRYLRGYAAAGPAARARRLREARRGSTTPRLRAWLLERVAPGLLRIRDERICAVEERRVRTETGTHGPYEEVYEATGYRVDVGNVGWLAPHVPRVCDGLPVLDRHLQATPGLHLTGPLAELELGPAGRNLWGAMRASERLAACAQGGR